MSYISQQGNFEIHYDISDTNAPSLDDFDSNDIPDYVEEVAQIAEDSRYQLVDVMGYLEEPSDGDGVYDIYIVNQTAWGWNVVEDTSIGSSYVKIDNDYSGSNFNSEYCMDNLDKMRISVAHEYFHAIQRAYRPNPTTDHDFLLEMSSMWFEDLMVPECNDYLSFVDALSYSIFNNPTQKFDGSDLALNQSESNFGYSMALFLHYLVSVVENADNILESTIVRKIWENYASGISARDAIVYTVEVEFNDSLPQIWSDFISRNMFCGYFNYFNEDFYFYKDQQYIDPISVNPSDYLFSNDSELYDMLLEPYSVNIISLGIMNDMIGQISLSDFDFFEGYYAIIGPSNQSHLKVNNDSMQLNLNSGDRVNLILSPVLYDVQIDISFESEDMPDSENIINIYPNPLYSYSQLYIAIQNNFSINDFKVEFYDILGSLISQYSFNSTILEGVTTLSIPISSHINSSGTYTLVLLDGDDKILDKKITFIK
tara:strand:- start:1143 stop:2594 length:1452 start_codon:yes stop_codon:yes gene_type:complete